MPGLSGATSRRSFDTDAAVPRLSVLLPVRDAADTLPECLARRALPPRSAKRSHQGGRYNRRICADARRAHGQRPL